MLNIFFDWLTKPQMEWTFIDSLFGSIEILILFFIGYFIYMRITHRNGDE